MTSSTKWLWYETVKQKVRNDQNGLLENNKSRYEMTKLGTKWPNWIRNDQIENKSGYEMTKMVRNDLGTKWPGYEMAGYPNFEPYAFVQEKKS